MRLSRRTTKFGGMWRSWQKLVETLSDHFGENASLGDTQRQAVLAYLLAHAADSPQAGREGRKFAQSIAARQTPLRITETPRWVREHREVHTERWKDPSKARHNYRYASAEIK